MPELRILCRVITRDPATNAILLVRNRGQKWWCAPGGGWDYDKETLVECAEREVFEESGIDVDVQKFLFTQSLYIKNQDSTWLEFFWLGHPTDSVAIPQSHIDQFGVVEEARWFQQSELEGIVVYPEIIRHSVWNIISTVQQEQDRYLGHFDL